jgi:CRP-like cAMP-binding protein
MRATTDSELAMLRSQDVLEICDEFPELEMRLQSFRKAGLKLSAKGEQVKQARKYKQESAAAAAAAQQPAAQQAAGYDNGGSGDGGSGDGGSGMSAAAVESIVSRLMAAQTSEVMRAVDAINAKLSAQQATLDGLAAAAAAAERSS